MWVKEQRRTQHGLIKKSSKYHRDLTFYWSIAHTCMHNFFSQNLEIIRKKDKFIFLLSLILLFK